MTRKMALEVIKVAGYHGDTATFTRTFIENRVSREKANEAWIAGQKMKASGVKCNCSACMGGKACG